MNSQPESSTVKPAKTKISSRGGARRGAGRKPGSRDNVTVKYLLEILEKKSGGQSYEELLVEDFLNARATDQNLTMKYHNILGSKLFSTLNKIEVSEPADALAQRQQAFAAAVAKIVGEAK